MLGRRRRRTWLGRRLPSEVLRVRAYEYWKDLVELAQAELARLESKGLSELDPAPEGIVQGIEEERSRSGRETAEARPVRLDKGQIVWLRPHGAFVDELGYWRVEVSDEPPRSDVAIVAAMTALETVPVEPPEVVREMIPSVEQRSIREPRREDLLAGRLGDQGEDLLDAMVLQPLVRGLENEAIPSQDPDIRRHLQYVRVLLRHYRPGFDELPLEERAVLVEHTSRYVNGFLESLRKLMSFVEHGTADGRISPAVKDVARDVRVAELHDISGLSYPKIGQIMGETPPERHVSKNDPATVRQRGNRGRAILEEAFGKEGWKRRIAAKRAEAEWWRSLSKGERWTEFVSVLITRAEFVGMPLEEARAYVSRIVDRKARAQGVTREEATRRWAERYAPTRKDHETA